MESIWQLGKLTTNVVLFLHSELEEFHLVAYQSSDWQLSAFD